MKCRTTPIVWNNFVIDLYLPFFHIGISYTRVGGKPKRDFRLISSPIHGYRNSWQTTARIIKFPSTEEEN